MVMVQMRLVHRAGPPFLDDHYHGYQYKIKTGADGLVERYNVRLVAKGYSQKYGMDYDETFCAVVRQESLRTLIVFAQ